MAHPDLNKLLNALLPLAQELLSKQGGFYPFGTWMGVDGQISHISGSTGTEHPESEAVIDLLSKAYRTLAVRSAIKAIGICFDVKTIPPGETRKVDAICCRLEHANGEAVDVLLPYRKVLPGKIKYGQVFASLGERKVFS